MHEPPSIPVLILAIVFAMVGLGGLHGEGEPGEGKVELEEAKMTLDAALLRISHLEERVDELAQSNGALSQALAESNLEVQKVREGDELAVKSLEALGIEVLTGDDALSGRLIKAVSDLRVAEEVNFSLQRQLMELSEIMLRMTSADSGAIPPSKAELLEAVDSTNRLLGRGGDGTERGGVVEGENSQPIKVVGIRPQLGLVIVNAGQGSGLREGTPLRLFRDQEPIGAALVVEVRQDISGAILTGDSEVAKAIAVGDTARLDLINSFKN